MRTECSGARLELGGFGRRAVVGRFDGGKLTSDGGGMLLREVERRTQMLKRLAGRFTDHRDPALLEHSVSSRRSSRPRKSLRKATPIPCRVRHAMGSALASARGCRVGSKCYGPSVLALPTAGVDGVFQDWYDGGLRAGTL